MSEIIYLPYSFYSKHGWENIINELVAMGYEPVKCYPTDKIIRTVNKGEDLYGGVY
jgi:hypothetical protein